MDNKGKFKKLTVIVMIVAVVISIISLAWVIIFKDAGEYERTNREFFEQTAAAGKHPQAVNSSTDSEETYDVEITVPVSFVLENINSDSRLTNEQKNMGFKSVTFDGESSVTYVISNTDHRNFLMNYRYEVVTELENSLKADYSYVDQIDYNDSLSEIIVKVDSSAYRSADAQTIATAASLPSMIYQLYADADVGCHVSFADAQTSRVIETVTP